MAYTQIVKPAENPDVIIENVNHGQIKVEPLTDLDDLVGGDLNYFHFIDLAKIKHLSRKANIPFDGFRFGLANVTIDGVVKTAAYIMLTDGKSETGAVIAHNQSGKYIAFSCPAITDQFGGVPLPI